MSCFFSSKLFIGGLLFISFQQKTGKGVLVSRIRIIYFNMKRDGNFKRNLTDGNQNMYLKGI